MKSIGIDLMMFGWSKSARIRISFKAIVLSEALSSSMLMSLMITNLFSFILRYKVAVPNAPIFVNKKAWGKKITVNFTSIHSILEGILFKEWSDMTLTFARSISVY